MTKSTPAQIKARYILIVAALLLPTLSLLPLGGLYLFEHGWLLYWAAGAFVAAGLAYLLQRSLLGDAERRLSNLERADKARTAADPALDHRAWADVQAIAARVDVDRLNSMQAFLELGQQTIDAVARRTHPEKTDAVWQFTMPEALLICERVSARLGRFVETQIPFGDRLTVAQLLAIYRWRGLVGVAERAYDVWRVMRLANPATAVTNEAREQLSRAVMNWSKERVGRRIAEAFVQEVGRAAIDLYGGRLQTSAAMQHDRSEIRTDLHGEGQQPGPIRAVVVGATDHRRVVAAALSEAVQGEADGTSIEVLVSDAIGARSAARRQLSRAARAADVIVWCVAGAGPLPGDLAATSALRKAFPARARKPLPPVVVVAIGPAAEASQAEPGSADTLRLRGWAIASPYPPHDPVVVPFVLPDSGHPADAAPLVTAIEEQVVLAAAASRARPSRSVVGQAVSAAGSLAGHLFRARPKDRPPA